MGKVESKWFLQKSIGMEGNLPPKLSKVILGGYSTRRLETSLNRARNRNCSPILTASVFGLNTGCTIIEFAPTFSNPSRSRYTIWSAKEKVQIRSEVKNNGKGEETKSIIAFKRSEMRSRERICHIRRWV